jgi:hypothetical protein
MTILEANEKIENLETAVFSDTASPDQIDDYFDACRAICVDRGDHLKRLIDDHQKGLVCLDCGSAS